MAEFESRETEDYFNEICKKYNIMHINFSSGHTITKNDIEALIRSITEIGGSEITREELEEFP